MIGDVHAGTVPFLRSTNDSVIYGSVGQNLTLRCYTANAGDSITWYFNNEPFTMGSDGQGELTFTPQGLLVEHSGWYTCAIANSSGRDEKDFLLIVEGEFPLFCVLCVILTM